MIPDGAHATETRFSDVASFQTNPSLTPSRWWTFTLPRTRNDNRTDSFDRLPSPPPRPERSRFREMSLSSWIPTSSTLREGSTFMRKDKEKESENSPPPPPPHLTIPMPPALATTYTLSHTATPGWDTPWTARPAAQGPLRGHNRESSYGFAEDTHSSHHDKDLSTWGRRKKQIRSFILVNAYAPLVRVPFFCPDATWTDVNLSCSFSELQMWRSPLLRLG